MTDLQKQSYASLKTAEPFFRAWASSQNIPIHRIDYIATFEQWDHSTEIYIFLPTNADLSVLDQSGLLPKIESAYRDFLVAASYPSERWPVSFHFDSHENVVARYEGNYFYRLR